jgi:two-component system, LytTR family, response regulator
MIKTLLIEDEPQNRDYIKKLLKDTAPFIQLVGETGQVDEAIALIKQTQPQLVIVDIQLYGRSAFDIFKEIGEFSFQIVFITAFEHFAIPAIKLSAVDYLLKPISPAEFKEAMQKVQYRVGLQKPAPYTAAKYQKEFAGNGEKLIISDQKELYVIKHEDVIYFEGDGNYTHVILQGGKKITSTKPISDYEEMLTHQGFYRVHKSYLINMAQVVKYVKGRGGEVIMTNGDTVYVSSRKKDDFLSLLGK